MEREKALEHVRSIGSKQCVEFFEVPLDDPADFDEVRLVAAATGFVCEELSSTHVARLFRPFIRGKNLTELPALSTDNLL